MQAVAQVGHVFNMDALIKRLFFNDYCKLEADNQLALFKQASSISDFHSSVGQYFKSDKGPPHYQKHWRIRQNYVLTL